MEGFEWVAELKNGMSRPAQEGRASLAALRKEISATDRELLQLNREMANASKAKPIAPQGSLAWMRAQRQELGMQRRELALSARDAGGGGPGLAAQLIGSLSVYTVASQALREMGKAAEWTAEKVWDIVAGGAKLAIEANTAREHMTRMFTGLGGSEAAGGATYKMVQQLRREVPQSEQEIAHWSATLMGAGITDPTKLKATIKAMASASALMGGGELGGQAADKIKTLIARAMETGSFKVRGGAKALVGTGITSDELAKALGMSPKQMDQAMSKGTIEAQRGIDALQKILISKGAGALRGEMGELPTIIDKAKESFSHLFDGVDVRGFLDEVWNIAGIFDQTRASGSIMHVTIRETFSGIMRAAASMVRSIHIGMLQAGIAVLNFEHSNAALFRVWTRLHVAGSLFAGTLGVIKGHLQMLLGFVQVVVAPFEALASAVERISALVGAAGGSERGMGGGQVRPAAGEMGPPAPSMAGPGNFGRSTPHAMGGQVMRPAEGEFFASVSPGETILPADASRALNAPQLGGASQGGGDTVVPVNVGGIHVHGEGQQELVDLIESQIADVFERAALEAGRS